MRTSDEPQLTQDAKEAIRSYMLKLITLPAVFATGAIFFAGYFAKDVFGTKAENAAYAAASVKILEMTAAASKAQAEAGTAKDQASAAISHAQETNLKLDEAAKQVDALLVKQQQNVLKTSSEVTQQLLKEPRFLDLLGRAERLDLFVRTDRPYTLRSATGNFALDIRDADQGVKNRQIVQVSYPNGEKAQDWFFAPTNP